MQMFIRKEVRNMYKKILEELQRKNWISSAERFVTINIMTICEKL